MEKNIEIAKQRIENGESFNGTVYQKNNGKNWATLFIYLDGKFFKIDEVMQKEAKNISKDIENQLCSKPALPKNEWLVNGKKVQNNLSYGEMWNMYGTDFE